VAHTNINGYCNAHQQMAVGWRLRQQGRTTTQRGYGYAWREKTELIWARDKGLCQSCYRNNLVVAAFAVDHKVPKFEGGNDDVDNLELICKSCHKNKTSSEAVRALRAGGY
jgi:5-methylcytosine-specific restriction enzyme A